MPALMLSDLQATLTVLSPKPQNPVDISIIIIIFSYKEKSQIIKGRTWKVLKTGKRSFKL